MIKILATLCAISTGQCHEQLVTNSDFEPGLTSRGCAVGMPQLAQFMASFPQYELRGWRCVPADAPQKERA